MYKNIPVNHLHIFLIKNSIQDHNLDILLMNSTIHDNIGILLIYSCLQQSSWYSFYVQQYFDILSTFRNIPDDRFGFSISPAIYLTIILALSTSSVILTIVVLDIYFNADDDEEPPLKYRKACQLIAKLICWKG